MFIAVPLLDKFVKNVLRPLWLDPVLVILGFSVDRNYTMAQMMLLRVGVFIP